jgi:tripartite-type tricarboxylate transporter receptor subunit TctC
MKRFARRRFLNLAASAALLPIMPCSARAQDTFPTKPIKIVLPVPAGSALDIAARAIGEQLAARWG